MFGMAFLKPDVNFSFAITLMGGWWMLRTIAVGSCVSIQGLLVRTLSDGKLVIKVDEKLFVGVPVTASHTV